MFTIDGVEYNVKCSIERTIEIRESSISGMLMNRQIFRDVLGTFYSYDIKLEMPLKNRDRYAALIELLSEPVDGHAFVVPYNNGMLALTGKADGIEDVWVKLPSGYTYWDGLRFTIEPNGPTKEPTLDGVIVRGRSPLPDVVTQQVGDTYTWNGTDWIETPNYDNADNIAY